MTDRDSDPEADGFCVASVDDDGKLPTDELIGLYRQTDRQTDTLSHLDCVLQHAFHCPSGCECQGSDHSSIRACQ